MDNDFYKAPGAELSGGSKEDVDFLLDVAQRQRAMLTAFGMLVGINYLTRNFMPEAYQWVGGFVTIALLLALVVTVVRLSVLLNHIMVTVLLGAASVVPLINLISLLILSRQSSNRLRARGIKVGFLGAKDEDIRKAFANT